MSDIHKVRQLKSLVRLRQLQHDKSASRLAIANMELAKAKENMLASQARYQLMLEIQRRFRQAGHLIDPLWYGNHLEAADTAKHLMDESIADWQSAKDYRLNQMNDFSLRHNQLNVARNAETSAKTEYQQKQERTMLDDCYDQLPKVGSQQMELA